MMTNNGATPPARSPDLDLDHALRALWRRRSVLVGAVGLVVAIALLVVFQIPPRYTATTLVMLSPRAPQVMDAAEVVPALGLDSSAVHSEVEVLRSRALAEAVVDAADLLGDPEFNPDLTPPPLWRPAFGLGPASSNGADPLSRERVVEAFRDALRADPVNRSLVVAIRVTARDAAKAARLADTVTVTDDNPRSEDPAAIRAEVLAGCPGATEIGDRRAAIHTAVAALKAGDILVIAGKGHETGQTIGTTVLPFDDRVEAAAALKEATP